MTAIALREETRPRSEDWLVRDATPADNASLIELAAACPMKGEMSLRMDRGPDFFALNKLEGDRWNVAVAERDGRVVGCIAMSERKAFVNGVQTRTGYVGDFKVHPAHRDTRIADALSLRAESWFGSLPPSAPLFITVLAGNRAMERRLSGPRGVAAFRRVGTIRTHSVPILWRRRVSERPSVRFEPARWSDLEEMVALWNRVGPLRQLAPVLSATSLSEWIREAPGLDISSYCVARSADGELLGFLAVWDQRSFKQLTVVGYSSRMKAARTAFNLLCPFVRAERLPTTGSPLQCVTIANLCVPSDRADVLRALVTSAYNDLTSSSCSFMNIGLDTRDPLSDAMTGFMGQTTDINVYMMTSRSGVLPERLDRRPV
ncbi:MAG TPA: GNAT family N-acetyltransferase, partial [Gemmatimonadaceae bacterium]|nr:GNAT family N-acetyltransferase [Gemmatimonadaceae bacterium]